MTNNTLHLTLKRRWFEEILAGRKLEEYREDKPYWRQRLTRFNGAYTEAQPFLQVEFRNGYAHNSPVMCLECRGIDNKHLVIEGLSGGKARRYFVIKLGKILFSRYLSNLRPAKCRLSNKLCKRFPCQYAGGKGCRRKA